MPGWWSVTGNEKGAGIAAGALDDQERELRIELMTVQIEHYQQQIKWEPWKAMATAFAAGAGFMGAIIALLGLILHLTGKL
jgi:hypothetical protein